MSYADTSYMSSYGVHHSAVCNSTLLKELFVTWVIADAFSCTAVSTSHYYLSHRDSFLVLQLCATAA